MSKLTNSYSFPVLEEDKFDYLQEISYEVKQIDTDSKSHSITFEHKLNGDSMITNMIKNKEAKFTTTVVLKSAMYRETISAISEEINPTHVKIEVPLKTTFETQRFFSSIIYTGDDKELTLDSLKMGLDDFWDGITIQLKKGSILAKDGWKELESTASDLLTIKKDANIKYGFDVVVIPEEGGKFLASVEPGLYNKINELPKNNSHLRSIVIHMLCLGFLNLAQDYKEDDSDLTNFRGIKRELENKQIKTWSDDDFNPNMAACYFLKHNIRVEESYE